MFNLLPKDTVFFDLFEALAKHAVSCAQHLQSLARQFPDVTGPLQKIREDEHAADELAHTALERLDRTFITPFDREDIHTLIGELDDIIDTIDALAKRFPLFHVRQMEEGFLKQAELLVEATMVVRDADILAELGRKFGATVYMSVPTVDEEAWRSLEPGTAPPLQRLRAVRQLRDAGVNAGVLMAPVVPGFTTQPAKLEATIKAIADHGASFMGANLLYLKGGTKDHFMGFLQKEFPHMIDAYNALYAGAYAPNEYVKAVRAMIDTLQQRYDLRRRKPRNDESVPQASGDAEAEEEKAGVEQPAFSWSEEP